MARYLFPVNDPDFLGVTSYSPLHQILCPEKPFGDVSAEEYLQFARDDFAKKSKAGLVSALSNAKRCFHYHTDRLLYRFGLRAATTKSKFPAKIDLLQDLRIVSGTLLKVYNRERNAMEHDYESPTEEVTEGSIDLCELYMLATERYLNNTPASLRVLLTADDRDLIYRLEPGGDSIEKFQVTGTTIQETQHGFIYKEPLYELASDEIAEGVSIQPLPDSEIPLRLNNKQEWLQALRMFSSAAREKSGPQYPDEPVAVISHTVPWRLAKQAFLKLGKTPPKD